MPTIGSVKAGQAFVVIGAIDDTGKVLSRIGRKLATWGRGLGNLGQSAFFGSLAALTPQALGLNAFMEFDDAMRRVQARTGATDAQMMSLRDTARLVGRDLGFTATQMATIMDTLSQREYSLADIQALTQPIAALAKATGTGSSTDMSNAAKLMSQVMASFKLGTGDATEIADSLAIAANKSNFALDDLMEAMSKVGPIARNMGMDFRQTIAIMAAMRNVEIQAETAGISLRNMLLQMSKSDNADKFNATLASLGKGAIKFVDQFGNLRDPAAILFEIGAALKGVGTATRVDALRQLFDLRPIVPAQAVGDSLDLIERLVDMMKNAPLGEASRIGAVMERGIGGVWRKFKADLVEVAIAFGTVLEPAIKSFGEKLSHVMALIKKWITENPGLVKSIVATSIALGGLGLILITTGAALRVFGLGFSILGAAVTTVMALTKVFAVFQVIVAAVLTPFLVLSTLATGIFAIFKVGLGVIVTVLTTLLSVGNIVIDVFVGIFGFLAPLIGPAAALLAVVALAATALGALEALFNNIGAAAGAAFQDAVNMGRQAAADIGNAFNNAWNFIARGAVQAFGVLREGMTVAFDLARLGQFRQAWEVTIATLSRSFVTLKHAAVNAFFTIADVITDKLAEAGDQIMLTLKRAKLMAIAPFHPEFVDKMMKPEIEGAKLDKRVRERQHKLDSDARQRAQSAEALKADTEYRKAVDAANRALQEAMKNIPADTDLGKKLAALQENIMGTGSMPSVPSVAIKPLEGLERGSIEAAKAAYENMMAQSEDGVEGQQLAALQGIERHTADLVKNLQVA